jgi:hypothetical protein
MTCSSHRYLADDLRGNIDVPLGDRSEKGNLNEHRQKASGGESNPTSGMYVMGLL